MRSERRRSRQTARIRHDTRRRWHARARGRLGTKGYGHRRCTAILYNKRWEAFAAHGQAGDYAGAAETSRGWTLALFEGKEGGSSDSSRPAGLHAVILDGPRNGRLPRIVDDHRLSLRLAGTDERLHGARSRKVAELAWALSGGDGDADGTGGG